MNKIQLKKSRISKPVSKLAGRILCAGLALVLSVGILSFTASAKEADSSAVVRGSYRFISSINSGVISEDTFEYRDDCFTRSSFLPYDPLVTLSAQTALASVDSGGRYIQAMLEDMGFEDVEENQYYPGLSLADSMGAAAGHRPLTASGTEYTLVAIVVRGAGYFQEWGGNLELGEGGLHEGFKQARDEVLRFLKQYISNHSIKGKLKIWISGHSRGGSVANLLGGFLAGGGFDYFGKEVSLTPQDLYCYAFAAPGAVKNSALKSEELCVSGTREGWYIAYDTPGEAYEPEISGTVNVKDSVYGGVRSYQVSYDAIPWLLPQSWGFTSYGSTFDLNPEGLVSGEAMAEELKNHSLYIYNSYQSGGDPALFREKTFDLDSLEITDLPGGSSGEAGYSQFLKGRISAFYSLFTPSGYAQDGWQDVLTGVGDLVGTLDYYYDGFPDIDIKSLIKPLLVSYLAYAAERLRAEGQAADDLQAAALTLESFFSCLSGREISNASFTVDNFFEMFLAYIVEHADSKPVQWLLSTVEDAIPSKTKTVLEGTLGVFYKGYSYLRPKNNPPFRVLLLNFFNACIHGADPQSDAYTKQSWRTGYGVRQTLYSLASVVLGEKHTDVLKAIGSDQNGDPDGSGSFEGFVRASAFLLLDRKEENGTVRHYTSFAELADDLLAEQIDRIGNTCLEHIEAGPACDVDYAAMARQDFETLKNNVAKVRALLFYFLFYTEGEPFSVESNLRNLATGAGNISILVPSHIDDSYVAWAKARDQAGANRLEYIEEKPATCTTFGERAHWLYQGDAGVFCFADEALCQQLGEEELVIKKKQHVSKPAVKENVVLTSEKKEAQYDLVCYCKTCGLELSRETRVLLQNIQDGSVKVSGQVYSGSLLTPDPVVKVGNKTLEKNKDYTLRYKNNKAAGTATLTVQGKGNYYGTVTKEFRISKVSNTITKFSPAEKVYKASALKKKAKTFQLKASVKGGARKIFTVNKAKTSAKAKKYIKITKDGKVTVKRGTPKGTYTVKVKVTAEGTRNYKKTTATKKIKIIVR